MVRSVARTTSEAQRSESTITMAFSYITVVVIVVERDGK